MGDRARRRPAVVALVAIAAVGVLSSCRPKPPPPPPPPAAPVAPASCSNPWRGYVVASDHNYAGIGAFNGSTVFMCKTTPTAGVRAHLQHLRNYADPASTPTNLGNPFEPRPGYTQANFTTFTYHGQAPRWVDLNGRWAVPGTTYAQTFVQGICNSMRARFGLPALDLNTLTIMGPSELTAAQIGQRVRESINIADWKPEISVEAMAQIFLDEGAAVGVRGDVAFCQSILETGWFRWPGSPSSASLADGANDPVMDVYFELQQVTERN
jgi:hypothetical protein